MLQTWSTPSRGPVRVSHTNANALDRRRKLSELHAQLASNIHLSKERQKRPGRRRELRAHVDRGGGCDGQGASRVSRPIRLIPEAGSWILQYKMYQYFGERTAADGTTRGWGMFATFAAADGRTNKSGLVLTLGLGGDAALQSRPHDRWGVAYTQDGVSFKYREQARPFNLNSENVLEAFYGFAITPFVVLSADLQVIRPMLQGSGTAVLPGARLVIEF